MSQGFRKLLQTTGMTVKNKMRSWAGGKDDTPRGFGWLGCAKANQDTVSMSQVVPTLNPVCFCARWEAIRRSFLPHFLLVYLRNPRPYVSGTRYARGIKLRVRAGPGPRKVGEKLQDPGLSVPGTYPLLYTSHISGILLVRPL